MRVQQHLSSSECYTEGKSHKEKDLNGGCKASDGKVDIFRLGTDYQDNKHSVVTETDTKPQSKNLLITSQSNHS